MDEEKKEGEGYKESEGENKKPVEDDYKASEEPIKEPFEPKQTLTDKLRKNPFIVSTIICGVLAVFLLIAVTSGGITGKVVSGEVAGENVLDFASSQLTDMEILNVEKESGLYKLYYSSAESDGVVYLTLDGKNLISGLIPLVSEEQDQGEQSENIPKSDKPVVELFIMTHCPYGTQAEKGMVPVIEALGDKIDATIRFVHYFMHELEETETPRQVCIREEQSEKWLTYLRCFLEDGDSDRCLLETSIDKSVLDDCIANRAEGYYAEDSGLSENDYGVRGSPGLVINGEIVSSARSPAAYLNTICQAFNDVPSECDSVLSDTNPSPMWGWDDSGASTTAQC